MLSYISERLFWWQFDSWPRTGRGQISADVLRLSIVNIRHNSSYSVGGVPVWMRAVLRLGGGSVVIGQITTDGPAVPKL